MPTLLEVLRTDNLFYETKLHLVSKFVPFIDFYTTDELLTTFERKNDDDCARTSLSVVNMNPFMIKILIYRIA